MDGKSSINKFELDHERKRVRSLVKSPEGRVALEEELGIKFAVRDETDNLPIVAILIPSRDKPKNQTNQALDAMIRESKDIAHCFIPPCVSSSVVHWVRNYALVNLNKSKMPYTHVLFMDDDIVPSPNTLRALLSRDANVVGAVCTVRQDPPLPNARSFNPETFVFSTADIDRAGIWKVGAVGTGMMLITKRALDSIGEYSVSWRYWHDYLGLRDPNLAALIAGSRRKAESTGDFGWFEFLKNPYGDGEYGEDVSFCLKARECGFDVFADSTTKVGHVGDYGYSLEDYWHYRPQAIAEGKVVKLSEGAAIPIPTDDTVAVE